MTGGAMQHILERAQAAIDAYNKEHDDSDGAPVRDLLCDLMHWCKFKGIDFDHELSMGTDFYGDESAD